MGGARETGCVNVTPYPVNSSRDRPDIISSKEFRNILVDMCIALEKAEGSEEIGTKYDRAFGRAHFSLFEGVFGLGTDRLTGAFLFSKSMLPIFQVY